MNTTLETAEWTDTKRKLVDASVNLMRKQGFHATTVDHICAEAGVTKGCFFHYFKSKEDVAKATIEWFGECKVREHREASYRKLADPLDRIFGRLEFAKETTGGAKHLTKGCLIGTIAQEMAFTHPELRSFCQQYFTLQARDFEKDLIQAKTIHAPNADFDPKNLATMYVSVIQGSLMLAKTSEHNTVLYENIEQFRRYLSCLFNQSATKPANPNN